jgi:hypothetical protein
MVDVSSIVVAILSLVGTLLIGIAGLVYTWNSDERKRRSEAENLVAKYRDPLMIAAHDLRSRLYGLSDLGLAEFHRGDANHRDNLRMYTAFVVGQYLSWTYILQRKAQFLKFSTNKNNNHLTRILAQITDCFASGSLKTDPDGTPFQLWRAHQIAIGELMTVHDGTELYCMGYAAFRKAYHASVLKEKEAPISSGKAATEPMKQMPLQVTVAETNSDLEDPNPDFKSWFQPIVQGAETVALARCAYLDAEGGSHQTLPRVPDQRIRKLQHLLFDLAQTLDPALAAADAHYKSGQSANDRCHRAEKCSCSTCKDNSICPSPDNGRLYCPFAHRTSLPSVQKTPLRAKMSGSKRVPV